VKYAPLLWAGLFRRKTRTVLTILSVVVSFLLLGLLDAVTVAFESGADTADAKRLLTTARYSIIEPLPLSYLGRIEQVPGVVGVAHADWFGATRTSPTPSRSSRWSRRATSTCTPSSPSPAHREALPGRAPAVAGKRSRIASGGRSGRSCRSAPRSIPRPTAA
jgi:hypothetical protein